PNEAVARAWSWTYRPRITPQPRGRASRLAELRLEPEASQPARFGAQCHGDRMWLDPIDVPRRWSLRRRVERGGDTGPGLIQFGGPPLIRPGSGETRQCGRVGFPLCPTFG